MREQTKQLLLFKPPPSTKQYTCFVCHEIFEYPIYGDIYANGTLPLCNECAVNLVGEIVDNGVPGLDD